MPYSYYESNLLDDLKHCKKPKLFIVGVHDAAEQTREVKEAYEISHSPKRFFELDSGHGYRYDPNAIGRVNAELTKFVQDFNLG